MTPASELLHLPLFFTFLSLFEYTLRLSSADFRNNKLANWTIDFWLLPFRPWPPLFSVVDKVESGGWETGDSRRLSPTPHSFPSCQHILSPKFSKFSLRAHLDPHFHSLASLPQKKFTHLSRELLADLLCVLLPPIPSSYPNLIPDAGLPVLILESSFYPRSAVMLLLHRTVVPGLRQAYR